MNKTLLVVINTIFIFAWVGVIYGQDNPLNQLNQPTTPQAFHTTGDQPTTSTESSTQNTDTSSASATPSESSDSTSSSNQMSPEEEAAQLAHIREIEQKAKSTVDASVMPTPPVSSSTSNNVQALQAQIVRFAQMTNSTQQQLSDRLAAVSKQNQQLEKKLASMTKAMQQMQLVIDQIGDSSSNAAPPPAAGVNSKMVQAWKPWLMALSVVVVLLLLLNVYSIWSARHQSTRSSSPGELDEEYDFMSTEEAIPAKLDLARAYVQMGDATQAREVLEEILASKNPDYVTQAKALMKSLSESEENKHD